MHLTRSIPLQRGLEQQPPPTRSDPLGVSARPHRRYEEPEKTTRPGPLRSYLRRAGIYGTDDPERPWLPAAETRLPFSLPGPASATLVDLSSQDKQPHAADGEGAPENKKALAPRTHLQQD